MIATLKHVELLDESEALAQVILKSEQAKAYKQAKKAVQNDPEAQQLIQDFNYIKDDYDEIQRFGRYHPDYNKIMRRVRSRKRKMDMNDKVAQFKLAERQLQALLDDISETIANTVSEQIIVPKDSAFLNTSGCGSAGCGTGGSCSCQAS